MQTWTSVRRVPTLVATHRKSVRTPMGLTSAIVLTDSDVTPMEDVPVSERKREGYREKERERRGRGGAGRK